MHDPMAMTHPNHVGATAAHSALEDAGICARKLLSILDEAAAELTKEQEATLITQGVANGIGVLIHLTRAVVYSAEEGASRVADGLPGAGRGY